MNDHECGKRKKKKKLNQNHVCGGKIVGAILLAQSHDFNNPNNLYFLKLKYINIIIYIYLYESADLRRISFYSLDQPTSLRRAASPPALSVF